MGRATASKTSRMWSDGFGTVATRSLQIIVILILSIGVIYAIIQLKIVAIPIVLALIIASAFSPLVTWMKKKGMPAALASSLALLASVLVIGGIITLIVAQVQQDWANLTAKAVDGFDKTLAWVSTLDLPIDVTKIEQLQNTLIDFVMSGNFATGALSGVAVAGEIATSTVLTIVILFFFMKDGPMIWRFLTARIAPALRARTDRIGERSVTVLGGYVRGTATVALVDAIGIGAALVIMQVPLALPLTLIVFIGSFVPMVGATVAGILAALIALVTNGVWGAVVVVAVVVLVNQLEGNFLQPVVMGNALKLHPLVILLALAAGTVLGGIIGAILSVPLTAVSWAIVKAWFTEENSAQTPPRPKPIRDDPESVMDTVPTTTDVTVPPSPTT
ncbi:AI-2E family transporter [Klugiella xanthotipulae]|uniref:Putative PurR-regulated permease PerM n=1 Tax=Klugiella xanthotipulae TaxID=244735 RepID=A0A543HSX9_9MICO|nr:AI-2E family transporter [Klugiella xanthotipulae]TQM61441.1 putative PurR-regulated permease PerM [Klugiella xanthotipulae]